MSAFGPKRTSLAATQFFNFDVDLPERRCQRFISNARQFMGDV